MFLKEDWCLASIPFKFTVEFILENPKKSHVFSPYFCWLMYVAVTEFLVEFSHPSSSLSGPIPHQIGIRAKAWKFWYVSFHENLEISYLGAAGFTVSI